MPEAATTATHTPRRLALALLVLGVACSGAGGTASTGATTGASGGRGGGSTGGMAGGAVSTAGADGAGGAGGAGGAVSTAGAGGAGTGGAAGTGGGGPPCAITVISASTSPQMPTVGIVEWSTTAANPTAARIVYTLNDAAAGTLDSGGAAPVDLTRPNHRTLLLGLKPSRAYTFHVEVTAATTCRSDDQTLSTGTLPGAPTITRTAPRPAGQAGGFIVTSTGVSRGDAPQAYIIDADGDVVWVASAPESCSRARMDYEGDNMWMIGLNVLNSGGEMRSVSMDGATVQNDVAGLARAHHDFTVRRGGVIATMVWSAGAVDAESDLVERAPDGTLSTVLHIGANLYKGGPSLLGSGSNTYHCNSLLYHAADDSYTIGDRNPSLFVKVTRAGRPVWQFGGDCAGAPAPRCAAGGWNSNHGHQLLASGNFLFFSNGAFGGSDPSTFYEYALDASTDGLTAIQVTAYRSASDARSNSLGDVQRLANGNTLITFSNDGLIEEVDSSSQVVQTLSAPWFGYAQWRPTLYGPPER